MKAIGARLSRAVNRTAGRAGRVLADRYHVRMLPTPREVHRALRYVLLNSRRHASKAARAAIGKGLPDRSRIVGALVRRLAAASASTRGSDPRWRGRARGS
jgi:hypothetical protein